jgi:hypothetical protein
MEVILLIAVVALLLVAFSWWSNRAAKTPKVESPSSVAARHLRDQVAAIDLELATATRPGASKVPKILDAARSAHVERALRSLPTETITVRGTGARLYELLRGAGIRTVADLDGIEQVDIEGIGDKIRSALLDGRTVLERDAAKTFDKLSEVEVDALTGGQISEAKEDQAAQDRQSRRRVELLQVKRAELIRRAKEAALPDPGVAPVPSARDAQPARASVRKPDKAAKKPGIMEATRSRQESKCPRCSGTLKQRQGRYGSFVGCSNFPTCRYTRNGSLQPL